MVQERDIIKATSADAAQYDAPPRCIDCREEIVDRRSDAVRCKRCKNTAAQQRKRNRKRQELEDAAPWGFYSQPIEEPLDFPIVLADESLPECVIRTFGWEELYNIPAQARLRVIRHRLGDNLAEFVAVRSHDRAIRDGVLEQRVGLTLAEFKYFAEIMMPPRDDIHATRDAGERCKCSTCSLPAEAKAKPRGSDPVPYFLAQVANAPSLVNRRNR